MINMALRRGFEEGIFGGAVNGEARHHCLAGMRVPGLRNRHSPGSPSFPGLPPPAGVLFWEQVLVKHAFVRGQSLGTQQHFWRGTRRGLC